MQGLGNGRHHCTGCAAHGVRSRAPAGTVLAILQQPLVCISAVYVPGSDGVRNLALLVGETAMVGSVIMWSIYTSHLVYIWSIIM